MELNHGLRGEEMRDSEGTPEREPTEPASGRTPYPENAQDLKKGWRKRLAPCWVRQPFWIKVVIFGSTMSVTVFLVVFAIGKFRAPRPVLLTSRLAPGPMSLRPRVPIRSLPLASVDVAGIASAGGPGFRTPVAASPSVPSPGPNVSPSPQGLLTPPQPTTELASPAASDALWRQMGAVAVDVARLNQAIQRLDAENVALLRGQEWIEREMSRGSRSRVAATPHDRRSNSAPMEDDRSATSSSPSGASSPILTGWRVIGVSGTGAVLVDPAGNDHLVRKGREVQGVQVTGIDPETGAVAFSDGEILKP